MLVRENINYPTMMVSKRLSFTTVAVLIVFVFASKEASAALKGNKLFVFGNAYVDTGNTRSSSFGWKKPYGQTFPGEPTGRMSDGKVWSDFIAKHLKLLPPVSYERRRNGGNLKSGMNFAYAGTGVFKTKAKYPSMTRQINNFQRMVKRGVYKRGSLKSAVALVCVGGDDLDQFKASKSGQISPGDWNNFQKKTVDQMIVNINRIYGLGVRSIVVNSLQPLGCLPYLSSGDSFKSCNSDGNRLATNQNQILKSALKSLADQKPQAKIYYVDFFTSWSQVLNTPRFGLTPCCAGARDKAGCGSVASNKARLYTLCGKPSQRFFWDKFHPTQQGWTQVYVRTKSTFNPL